jgi:hypothetical protein
MERLEDLVGPANCEDCQNLFDTPMQDDSVFKIGRSLSELEQGSRRACDVCHLVCSLSRPTSRQAMEERFSYPILAGLRSNSRSWMFWFRYDYPHENGGAPKEGSEFLGTLELGRDESEQHKTMDRWDIARHWFEQCGETHSGCEVPKKQRSRPSRLVDIGLNGSIVRVIVSGEMDSCDQYRTLSHCWGNNMPLRLLTENIDQIVKKYRGPAIEDVRGRFTNRRMFEHTLYMG